jgi:hypothetical protein
MTIIKNLLQFNGEDFEVWKSKEYGITYYNIAVEGYIGFDNLDDAINLYDGFRIYLKNYLETENYKKTERDIWKCLYRTRAVEVYYEHGCYWIFLEPYKSTQIWDIYYYIEDVIQQLKEFNART